MHRSSSPLLHDYRPTATKTPKKSRALQWFVVGLGAPFLGLALISTLDLSERASPLAPQTPIMTAVDGDEFGTEHKSGDFVVSPMP